VEERKKVIVATYMQRFIYDKLLSFLSKLILIFIVHGANGDKLSSTTSGTAL
jgi:hypothetical protein